MKYAPTGNLTLYFIDPAIEAWDQWAYERVIPEPIVRAPWVHECAYYPRKVPRCPACEAGIPRRKT